MDSSRPNIAAGINVIYHTDSDIFVGLGFSSLESSVRTNDISPSYDRRACLWFVTGGYNFHLRSWCTLQLCTDIGAAIIHAWLNSTYLHEGNERISPFVGFGGMINIMACKPIALSCGVNYFTLWDNHEFSPEETTIMTNFIPIVP